jgi:hypothetical protein
VVGSENPRCVPALDELSPRHGNLEARPEHRLGGRGPEAADDLRLQRGDLRLQPRAAGFDLTLRRRLVQAALAARLPFEVLHGVGDVKRGAVDSRRFEGTVEQASRRPDKGQPAPVLLVAGLLADQHQPGARGSGAEHRLRRMLPQRAVAAAAGVLAQRLQGLGHRSLESRS